MAKPQRIEEIPIVRALAMLGVLAVHGTSTAVVQLGGLSDLDILYYFVNRFGKLGTPTFIFIMSLVLFYSYGNRPWNKQLIATFYKRRFLYILIPYLIWSVSYYFIRMGVNNHNVGRPLTEGFQLDNLFSALLWGKAYGHLYFVLISVQLYLLFPLILWLFQTFKRTVPYWFLAGIMIQWSFYFLNKFGYISVQNKASFIFTYLTYITLGIIVGSHFNTFKAWLKKRTFMIGIFILWLLAGTADTLLIYFHNVHGMTSVDSAWYEFTWNTYTLLSAVFLCGIAVILHESTKRGIQRVTGWLKHFGTLTFGVYLLHPLLLLIWREISWPNTILIYHMRTWLGILVVFLLSWLIVALFHRFAKPVYLVLFGQWAVLKPLRVKEQT